MSLRKQRRKTIANKPEDLKYLAVSVKSSDPFNDRVERLSDFALFLAEQADKSDIVLMALYMPRAT